MINIKYGVVTGRLESTLDIIMCDVEDNDEKLELLAEFNELQSEIDKMYINYLQRLPNGVISAVMDELKELKNEIKPLTKALQHRTKEVNNKNEAQQIREKIRAKKALK